MFYSQFILAKKGPLGTIWIAAHLERKLRKNQVADTDIGESVDSILFPDVPIALRLSSHLLLGVVRIYSRKVNYLFHDCSDALLRIKQAFRSTAVDLPPEQSTAPYHSITLPETFDLDVFELPDSALLSGNFVDHHVSAREQITLQDTVGAIGYSTSQFGLDERFGDGDSSQIRLDLDEDVVLESESTANRVTSFLGSESVEHNSSGQHEMPFQEMDVDCCQNDCEQDEDAESGKVSMHLADHLGESFQIVQDPRVEGDLSLHVSSVQGPCSPKGVSNSEDANIPLTIQNDCVVSCHIYQVPPHSVENAQAPSTPGLMQEAIPASVQENPALSPPGKASPSNYLEAMVLNASHSCHMESENPNQHIVSPAITDSPEHLIIPRDELILTSGDSLQKNGDLIKETRETQTHCSQDTVGPLNGAMTILGSGSSLKPCIFTMNQAVITSLQNDNSELFHEEPFLSTTEFPNGKEEIPITVELQGEGMDINQILHSPHEENINKDDALANIISKDAGLEINCSASSEYPETERMLLATGGDPGVANDFGQLTTAEKGVTESDGSIDRVKSTRGRKRRLIEATPIPLNDENSKSRASQLGKHTDYIPGDDDVLASILVGRSSGLKMKPTPTLPALPSKCPRLSARTGVYKRKVFLDDTMVLHADVIRQQLINTEDIRRTRRKAPCTRPEIWMIQKSSLGEGFLAEPVLTDMSMELAVLHCQTYDLNEISAMQDNDSGLHVKVSEEQIPRSTEFLEEARVEEIKNTMTTIAGKSDCGRQDVTKLLEPSRTMPSSHEFCNDNRKESSDEICQPKLSDINSQYPVNSDDLGRGDAIGIRADTPSLPTLLSGNECHLPSDTITEMPSIDQEKGENEMCNRLSSLENQPLQEPAQSFEGSDEINDKLGNKVSEEAVLTFAKEGYTHLDGLVSYPKDSDLDGFKAMTDDVPTSMDYCSTEVGAAFLDNSIVLVSDTSTFVQNMDIPDTELINFSNSTCIQSLDMIKEQDKDPALDDERMKDENGAYMSEVIVAKEPPAAMSNAEPSCSGLENHACHTGTENNHVDCVAHGDSNVQDFYSGVDGNGTDFLNVDDEADFDDGGVENDIPDTEQSQSIENNRWSSRTRGVARYLRSLFDDESGKAVAMDRLLAGKTRKEASRMFFETLVLKTKDYIHVEQEDSFRNINIRPRSTLLKTEF